MPEALTASSACSVSGCSGKHKGRGLCAKHLLRLRKYGDTSHIRSKPKILEVRRQRHLTNIGQIIGDLTFLGLSEDRGDGGRALGRFICACGNEGVYAVSRILSGKDRTHCGCRTNHGAHSKIHGMRGTPEYSSWRSMKARCLDADNKDFPRWGGRGIEIHPEWIESFDAFYAHLGPRPDGTTLDRNDTTKGYVPGNVQWSPPQKQAENRLNSWFVRIGTTVYASVQEAARASNVSDATIVRWCDGFTDKRRLHTTSGGYTPPRDGCVRWRKYA